ncbi:MAG: CotH kinase family protein, partial [Ruminococcus sp.]|nr:CotH kinase family protein [Ruminococcus sp.]
MLASKHINKIVAALMSVIVILCFITMIFSEKLIKVYGDTGLTMEYQSKLFNTDEIMNVNIIMDDDKWQEMLDNPMAEEYYQCDVKINGETFYNVGIRPKGNTSLSSIASDETTDRYSFKLEFDQYVDGQTCYGLDKLILNNNYADATNMKEALIYDMYAYLGADASLYNYAKIFVNDEYWGVYTALEAVEDSFLLRNYGVDSGELYKPETMGIGGGDNKDGMDFGNMKAPPDNFSSGNSNPDNEKESTTGENIPQTDKMPNMDTMPEMPDKGEMPDMNGGFSMGGNGANLNYSDDDLDSYSTIWEGEVGNTSKNDHKRVVKALKNISEGTDLETYMDIDNLLKYMAVHVFSVNEDSLSGMMAHNYYLYEENGKLNIIPWDYNLSLGGMGGMGTSSDATDTINDPIDNAFSGTEFFDT